MDATNHAMHMHAAWFCMTGSYARRVGSYAELSFTWGKALETWHSQNSGLSLVWKNSKFAKDWLLLLKNTQGVNNLSIIFQDYEESWAEIWVEMDYIDNPWWHISTCKNSPWAKGFWTSLGMWPC
jgi:hypothetical protein